MTGIFFTANCSAAPAELNTEFWQPVAKELHAFSLSADDQLAYHSADFHPSDLEVLARHPELPLVEMRIVASEVRREVARLLTCFPFLQTLELSYTHIDPVALEFLKHVQSLQKLSLDFGNASDFHMAALCSLPSLGDLSLRGTALTDSGLEDLSKMETLKALNVEGSRVTRGGD